MPFFTLIDPIVEAVQVSPSNYQTIQQTYPNHISIWQDPDGWLLEIEGKWFRYWARNTDWVVRFSATEFTVMSNASFVATYQAV